MRDASVMCIKAGAITALALLVLEVAFGVAGFWTCILTVFSAFPIAYLYAFSYGFFIGAEDSEEYKDSEFDEFTDEDFDEDEAEKIFAEEYPWLVQDDSVIFEPLDETTEVSEKTLGTFKGAPLHEYIIVNHPAKPGERLKVMYDMCIHDITSFKVPEDCWYVLIEPGIMYTAPAEPEFIDGSFFPAE